MAHQQVAAQFGLSSSEADKYYNVFKELDVDGNGSVDETELFNGFYFSKKNFK